jgi:ribosome-binding protein aMBF1 (putative translation factor)
MRCPICGKNEGTNKAIINREVISICDSCARTEGLPLIHKPTQEQLARANQRYTVRERMMKLSGMDKLHPVSRDHEIAQRHLGKIRVPEKVQESSSLVDNYNWKIKIARRRKKITLSQLSQITGIPADTLDSLEKGMLVKDYQKIALKMENALGIPLLKEHEKTVKFIMPKKEEPVVDTKTEKALEDLELEELRRSVKIVEQRRKMEEKQQIVEEIKKGEMDFGDKKKTSEITLNDLIEAKKQRERAEKEKERKTKGLFGSDLELE